jgi:Fe-S oxidoreductase
VLFVDTFTRGFRPEVAGAAARVLVGAGERTECSADACCGLTWISTGQLDTAKKLLRNAAEVLDDGTDRPIVVVEPSCAAALRKDLPELVHTDQAKRVAARVRSFASHVDQLARAGWSPAPAEPLPEQVVLQTHCHEYSVFGAGTQKTALAAVGISGVVDATGCCGVAGNFGFEKEHYGVSMQVAEQALAPALRNTGTESVVLTDGFSCAMQVRQLDDPGAARTPPCANSTWTPAQLNTGTTPSALPSWHIAPENEARTLGPPSTRSEKAMPVQLPMGNRAGIDDASRFLGSRRSGVRLLTESRTRARCVCAGASACILRGALAVDDNFTTN